MKEECDHDFDFDHCMRPSPCLKCGIEMWEVESNAIPWKKPSERPEENRTLIVVVQGVVDDRFATAEDVYTSFWRLVQDWCYADELPLPEWVKK